MVLRPFAINLFPDHDAASLLAPLLPDEALEDETVGTVLNFPRSPTAINVAAVTAKARKSADGVANPLSVPK